MEFVDCDCIPKETKEETKDQEERIIDLPEGVPALRSFYLYLSTSCNLKCCHCWITPRFVDGKADPGDVIDLDLLKEAVKEAKSMGLGGAKLTGGEPLLHPKIKEMVDFLTAEGLSLNMETNGTLMTAELAQHFKDKTNLSFISVSIDGDNAEYHDAFRGVPGAFEGVLRGLDHLVAAGYKNAQVIMCVHKGNMDQLEGVIKLAMKHGAGSVKINPIANYGRGSAIHDKGDALDYHGRIELARWITKDLREKYPIKLVHNLPPALRPMKELWASGGKTGDCGVLGIMGLLGSGELVLCGIGRTVPELIYGRLGEDSIKDIWLNNPTILKLRKVLEEHENYPGICGACTFAKGCRTGCVAQNFVNGQHLVWPDKLCAEADRLKEFPETRRK